MREQVKLPPGYAALWSGQYGAMARVRAKQAGLAQYRKASELFGYERGLGG